MNKNEVVEVLMRSAEEQGLIPTLYAVFGKGLRVSLPLSRAVCAAELDNLEFSVRATNALKRAGIFTVGALADVINGGELGSIRNLGKRTENEIKTRVLAYSYENMGDRERRIFMRELVDANCR